MSLSTYSVKNYTCRERMSIEHYILYNKYIKKFNNVNLILNLHHSTVLIMKYMSIATDCFITTLTIHILHRAQQLLDIEEAREGQCP